MFKGFMRRLEVFCMRQNYKDLVENRLSAYLCDDIGSRFFRRLRGEDWWCSHVSYLLTLAEDYIHRIEEMGAKAKEYDDNMYVKMGVKA